MSQVERAVEKGRKSSPPTLGALVERASGALAVISAATLGLSAFYDFSYLKALGLNFGELPTSISDHVRSALVWIPTILGSFAFVILWELLSRRIEGFQSEEEIIQGSENPEQVRKWRRRPDKFLATIACLTILTQFLFSTSDSSWYLIFFCAWGVLATTAVVHERMRPRFNTGTALAFILIPLGTSIVGYLGFTQAESALRSPKEEWKVSLVNERGEVGEAISIARLRRFSSTAVLVTTKGEVHVVPDVSIRVAARAKPPPQRSVVCIVSGFRCELAPPEDKKPVKPQAVQPQPQPQPKLN